DLLSGSRHRRSQLPSESLIRLVLRDVEEEHAHDLEIVDRARGAELFELFFDRRSPLLDVIWGILNSDPAGQSVLGDALRRDLRDSETPEKNRWVRLLHGFHAEAAFLERG